MSQHTPSPPDTPCALEKIPHIAKKVTLMWGTRELDTFIGALMTDTRGDSRQGFPLEAASELLFLVQCNKLRRAIDATEALRIDFAAALAMVEKGDQAARGGDGNGWQDPQSSNEAAVISRKRAEPPSRLANRAPTRASGGLLYWLGRAMVFLLRSKPFWFIVGGVLTAKIMARQFGIGF